jgi:hypothetical protein
MTGVHQRLKKRLEEAVESMRKHYNKKRKDTEPFKKGDLVLFNGRNIRAKHHCKKLEDKMLGPFEIVSVGSNNRYCKLILPDHWKLHPVFNIELLERYQGTDPKRRAIEIEANREGWVMESIIASRPSVDNRKQHVFLVKWKNFTDEENMWETYGNVMEHGTELLEEYYKKNPEVEKDSRFDKKMGRKKHRKRT